MVMPRSMEICPSSGDSSRMIMRNTVDLPAPFGPTSPIFSPRKIAADASMNRICGPCCLLIWSRRITWGAQLTRLTAVDEPVHVYVHVHVHVYVHVNVNVYVNDQGIRHTT